MGERSHRYRDTSPDWIFLALTKYRGEWLKLHPEEVQPDVLEAVSNERVVWSSFWPISPSDTIEITLTRDRRDTLLKFRWLTDSPPDERGVGITRQRLNTQFGGNIRGWLAS